ncbi:MAG TPA: EamA family transporter [Patescibacteria group bacterium]|nr:EamA family transporter [Patescibacteria group bacterium]
MQSWLWLPLAFGSAFFAALVAIFGKIGVDKIDSNVATMVRAAIMFVFMLAVVLASGKIGGVADIRGKAMLFVILAGIAGAASWILYFWALKVGKASQVAPIDRFSAVITLVLAAAFLAEKVSWKTGIGAVIMTIGAILVALG